MEAIEVVDHFTYLGSVVDTQGETEADVKVRIGKSQEARVAFLQLKNIWKSNVLSLKNKTRILNTNVEAVLLYGAQTWRTAMITTKRIQTFVNSCLRRIVGVWWPEIISINDCGSAHVRCRWNRRSDRDDGDGLVILSANQST